MQASYMQKGVYPPIKPNSNATEMKLKKNENQILTDDATDGAAAGSTESRA